MQKISDLIKYQSDVVEKEEQKLEELERLQELHHSSNPGARVELEQHDTDYFKLHISSHELSDALDEITNMSIVGEVDANTVKRGKIHLECEIEYTPMDVASSNRHM